MSNKDLVSIIVPVYGVEAYLSECVDSLLAQVYQNIEILLIDDGSPDNCPAICDAYAAQDSRVHVIHKKNGGAASARNVGLDVAHGEYICFVDSDDLVCSDYIEKLYTTLSATEADIAVCGFTQMSRDGEETCFDIEKAGVYNRNDYIVQFLRNWTCALLWNKIFKKNVIGPLRMEEGHRIDDEFFTYQIVLNCNTITVFDLPLYRYRLRASSVMQKHRTNNENLMLDRIEYMQQRYENISKKLPNLQPLFFIDMTDSFARYWLICKEMPAAKKILRQWAIKNVQQILTSELTWKQKITYLYTFFLKRNSEEDLISAQSTVEYFL